MALRYIALKVMGGIVMDAQSYWELFLETGAPEIYMLYRAQIAEDTHVRKNTGAGASGIKLQ